MPLDVSRIRALCFDVDGTLNDTDDLYFERFLPFFRPLKPFLPGRDPERAARRFVLWAEAPGNALIGLPDRLGIDGPLDALARRLTRGRSRRPKEFRLIPGVREMLTELAGRYPLAVVTARGEATTRQFLERFDLAPLFTAVVTSQTARHTKPYPDPIVHAARVLGVPTASCLMIGDTPVDIRSGRAAGCQTVGVLCGFGERAELERRGADLILGSTADLTLHLPR